MICLTLNLIPRCGTLVEAAVFAPFVDPQNVLHDLEQHVTAAIEAYSYDYKGPYSAVIGASLTGKSKLIYTYLGSHYGFYQCFRKRKNDGYPEANMPYDIWTLFNESSDGRNRMACFYKQYLLRLQKFLKNENATPKNGEI